MIDSSPDRFRASDKAIARPAGRALHCRILIYVRYRSEAQRPRMSNVVRFASKADSDPRLTAARERTSPQVRVAPITFQRVAANTFATMTSSAIVVGGRECDSRRRLPCLLTTGVARQAVPFRTCPYQIGAGPSDAFRRR